MTKHESRIKALLADIEAVKERLALYTEIGYTSCAETCKQDIAHLEALIAYENKKNSQITLEK